MKMSRHTEKGSAPLSPNDTWRSKKCHASLKWPYIYLVSERKELHDTLDGEEDGEDQVAVGQHVRELQRSTVILK